MKFTCDASLLKSVLGLVGNVSADKSALPIYQYILFNAGPELVLVASDGAITVALNSGILPDKQGVIAVPSKMVNAFAARLNGEVEVNLAKDTLEFDSGQIKAKIKCLPGDDFPDITPRKPNYSAVLNQEELALALKQVAAVTDAKGSRPIETGVCFDFAPGALTVAGGNGFQLSCRTISADCDFTVRALAHTSQVAKLVKLLGYQSPVTVNLNDSQIEFVFAEGRIIIQLLDEKYVDYVNFLGKENNLTSELSVVDLRDALSIASVFSQEEYNHAVLIFNKSTVTVQSTGSESGSNTEIPCKTKGKKLSVALDITFVQNALKNLTTPDIVFKAIDSDSAITFVGEGGSLTAMLAPVHLKNTTKEDDEES